MHAGALLLLAALPALGADVRGRIVPNAHLNLSSIPLDSRVDLDYGAGSAMFRSDGSFELTGVAPGQHVVRPLVPGYAVPYFIISVPDADEVPHVQSYYPDRLALPTTEPSLPYPLEVAGYPMQYYTPPPGMNVVQMFKSPMMIMMIFSAVMAIGLPKLTAMLEDMDPELSKDLREQQKSINNMQNMDWSGALSGKLAAGAAGEAPKPAAAPAPAARGGGAKRGGKRR